jgi:hypothetical protein
VHSRPTPDGTQKEGLVEPVGLLWHVKDNEKRKRDREESGNATKEHTVIYISGNDQGGAEDPIDKKEYGAYQAKELGRVVSICALNKQSCGGAGHP